MCSIVNSYGDISHINNTDSQNSFYKDLKKHIFWFKTWLYRRTVALGFEEENSRELIWQKQRNFSAVKQTFGHAFHPAQNKFTDENGRIRPKGYRLEYKPPKRKWLSNIRQMSVRIHHVALSHLRELPEI